jgi:hypothetical protein
LLYNILLEFGVSMKVRLAKICFNKTLSEVRVDKHLFDNFPIHSDLKLGNALAPPLLRFAMEYHTRKVQEVDIRRDT